jgi:transposase
LPRRHPPYQTCHRHFQKWEREDVFDRILRALGRHLLEVGKVSYEQSADNFLAFCKLGCIDVLSRRI